MYISNKQGMRVKSQTKASIGHQEYVSGGCGGTMHVDKSKRINDCMVPSPKWDTMSPLSLPGLEDLHEECQSQACSATSMEQWFQEQQGR